MSLALILLLSSVAAPPQLPLPNLHLTTAPDLTGARLEVVAPGRVRLRLARSQRLDAVTLDELAAALGPVLQTPVIAVEVVGPHGEDLSPEPIALTELQLLRERWHARHDGATGRARATRTTRTTGALSGVRIAISAGHGMVWRNARWEYQRDVTLSLREDLHNNELTLLHLVPMLEEAGADVVLVRERSSYPERIMIDNDAGASVSGSYSETGTWTTSTYAGHAGTYRYAYVSADGTARATYAFTLTRPQELPVYVWYREGSNRSPRARYEIDNAAGTTVVEVDQRRPSLGWRLLGLFPFAPGLPSAVHLTSQGTSTGSVVIADAIRLGGGAGFADFGGGVSGAHRWRQSANTYAVEEEAPSSVVRDDVTVRPAVALWQGVDLFLSVHSNAFDGTSSGTSTYCYWPTSWVTDIDPAQLPPRTVELRDLVHHAVVDAIRQSWRPAWRDGGLYGANFGELRPFTDAWEQDASVAVPAALIEVAFHDNAGDTTLLREDLFRRDVARGIYRGILRFVRGDSAIATPLPPSSVSARLTTAGVELRWTATADPLSPSATPTSYQVELSADGQTFGPPVTTTEPRYEIRGLSTCQSLAARVRAVNAGGRSQPSATVIARVSVGGPRVLWVDGVRRIGRSYREGPDLPNIAARTLADLTPAMAASLIIDSARAEAVAAGEVSMSDYDAVLWTAAETSSAATADVRALTSAEQSAITSYLGGGGALFITGAEIGWDLVPEGSAADQSFYRDVLRATYVSDSAGSYSVAPGGEAVWTASIPPLPLDDGSGGSYRVATPDVLAAVNGSAVELRYGTGTVAALRYEGTGRIFNAGFPLEAIEDAAGRAALTDAVLTHLLQKPAVPPTCGLPYGEPDVDDGGEPDGGAADGGDMDGGLAPDGSAPDGGAGSDGGGSDGAADGDGGAAGDDMRSDADADLASDGADPGGWGDGRVEEGDATRTTDTDLSTTGVEGCGCASGEPKVAALAALAVVAAAAWRRRRLV